MSSATDLPLVDYEAAAAPLYDSYELIGQLITQKEAELVELREHRNRLRQAVKALRPELLPVATNGAKKRPSQSQSRQRYSQATVDHVLDAAEKMGGEFSNSSLRAAAFYNGPGQSSLSRILLNLHETGVIRLARMGRGGERFYEVIK